MTAAGMLRRYLPASVKGFLRGRHRRRVLARAIRQLRCLGLDESVPESDLRDLIYGWGNEGWSASVEFIRGMLACARAARGPVLECGSGLSTLLLGLAVEGTGRKVWTLEHNPFWAERVRDLLGQYDIRSVEVCQAELRPCGPCAPQAPGRPALPPSANGEQPAPYWWYAVPKERLPCDFALVVCDGPPGNTPGGRIGLLPELRSHLAPGCIILLDDATHPGEQEVLARWDRGFGVGHELVGSQKPYARLTVPD